MLHIALIEPEIPPNTGNIARLCVAARARLHLIGPLGFSIDDRAVKRAGMDYWKHCDVHTWDDFETFEKQSQAQRIFLLTTKATRPYWNETFRDGDALVFGRESRGIPQSLLNTRPEACLTIPMSPEARSLNLATSAAIVLYEAVRQLSPHQ